MQWTRRRFRLFLSRVDIERNLLLADGRIFNVDDEMPGMKVKTGEFFLKSKTENPEIFDRYLIRAHRIVRMLLFFYKRDPSFVRANLPGRTLVLLESSPILS